MKRSDLEHLIRAASAVTNEYELIIVGSQSILGTYTTPPDDLVQSCEADIYPLHNEKLADLIDGTLGEGSPFHENFGYYAQGVDSSTSVLPRNWQSRLVKVQNQGTDNKIGYCLSVHDLAIAKLVAWREKDVEFLKSMFVHGLIERDKLISLIDETPLKNISKDDLLARIHAVCQEEQDPTNGLSL